MLLLRFDHSLQEGSAWRASAGLVADPNVPWCDLWGDLLDLVQLGARTSAAALDPAGVRAHAHAASGINPEECLGWADLRVPALRVDA